MKKKLLAMLMACSLAITACGQGGGTKDNTETIDIAYQYGLAYAPLIIAKEQGLEELFDGFFCPGFGSHVSDKSGLALEAVDFFKVKKEEAVLVGDTKFDLAAARDAGIECVGVLYGFSEKGELDSADYIAPQVKDIYPVLFGEKE